jgi:hypothetical protein
LLQDVVEAMIDELTTVSAYEVYVSSSLKKDMAKTSNKMIKEAIKKMTLEVAMNAIADETMSSVLSSSRVAEVPQELADILQTPSAEHQNTGQDAKEPVSSFDSQADNKHSNQVEGEPDCQEDGATSRSQSEQVSLTDLIGMPPIE